MVRDLLTPPPSVSDASVLAAEQSLAEFIAQAWHLVEPATEYRPNWHITMICEHLEAACRGEVRNLLITMPPRMMKSLCVSVFFPAWRWISEPGERFLYSSYSADLATDHSLASRRIIESDWYQARWGRRVRMARDQNRKTRFENTDRGVRSAAGVGGVSTGRGGDWVICDDPHNVKDAESELIRQETVRWWREVMSSRFNDPMTGRRIVVMQRVHEDDLAGALIQQGNYVHLNIPMEFEPEAVLPTGIGAPDPRTEPGELLAPDRVGPAEIKDLQLQLGSRAYAGQYQQRPAPAEGAILKSAWWDYWEAPLPPIEWLLQVWDTAFKKGQENDYSVGLTAGLSGGRIFVLDLWRDKVEFPQLKRVVASQYLKWRPDEVVVEDKASGQSLIQELAQEVDLGSGQGGILIPVLPFGPGVDKIQRTSTASPYVEGRRVLLPAGAAWLHGPDGFIDECAVFPAGRHDDQVDAIVMAILRLRDRMPLTMPLDPRLVASFADLPG